MLIVFLVTSVGQLVLSRYKERKATEDFYSQEIIKVYSKDRTQDLLKFFADRYGNKCVALKVDHEPIAKSVQLWEGGYKAPPITLQCVGKEVIFKYSAYSSYEEYKTRGQLYQVRYFPKQ